MRRENTVEHCRADVRRFVAGTGENDTRMKPDVKSRVSTFPKPASTGEKWRCSCATFSRRHEMCLNQTRNDSNRDDSTPLLEKSAAWGPPA